MVQVGLVGIGRGHLCACDDLTEGFTDSAPAYMLEDFRAPNVPYQRI